MKKEYNKIDKSKLSLGALLRIRGFMQSIKLSKMRGFTLTELLIIVIIISLLIVAVSANISGTRAKARDAIRISDIRILQNALASYHGIEGCYPNPYDVNITGSDGMSLALLNEGLIKIIPVDPLNSGKYVYHYQSVDGTDYTISFYLESNTIQGYNQGYNEVKP